MKDGKSRKKFSTTCHFEEQERDLYLITYALKPKSTGKTNVIMLSNKRRSLQMKTIDDETNTGLLKLHDLTKGSTDIVDQTNDYYTVLTAPRRWNLIGFFYNLDAVRVNIKTAWCLQYKLGVSKINIIKFSWWAISSSFLTSTQSYRAIKAHSTQYQLRPWRWCESRVRCSPVCA